MISHIIIFVVSLCIVFVPKPKSIYSQTFFEEVFDAFARPPYNERAPSQPFDVPAGEEFIDVEMSEDKATYTIWSRRGDNVIIRVFDRESGDLLNEQIGE